jgi:tetratricopeptide (TPR) repeat protein
MRVLSLIAVSVIVHSAAGQSVKSWDEWLAKGNAARDAGNYATAIQAFQSASAAAETAEIDAAHRLVIYDSLASACADAGQYAEAAAEYRKELPFVERLAGRHSISYAVVLGSVSTLPLEIGDREEAIAVLREAVTKNRQTGTPRELAVVRNQLATLLMPRKAYPEMERLLQDVVDDFDKKKSLDPVQVSAALNGLGVVRFNLKRFEEAATAYRRSIDLLESALGKGHPLLVSPLSNLGESYLKMGTLTEASAAYRRAADICDASVMIEDLPCGINLAGYAEVLRKQGRKREAKALETRSRRMQEDSRRRNGVGLTVDASALRSN